MSITQVAENAGVSKATVSRVINKVGNVSPDTVRLVHQAMKELNYHPPQSPARQGLNWPDRNKALQNKAFHARTYSAGN